MNQYKPYLICSYLFRSFFFNSNFKKPKKKLFKTLNQEKLKVSEQSKLRIWESCLSPWYQTHSIWSRVISESLRAAEPSRVFHGYRASSSRVWGCRGRTIRPRWTYCGWWRISSRSPPRQRSSSTDLGSVWTTPLGCPLCRPYKNEKQGSKIPWPFDRRKTIKLALTKLSRHRNLALSQWCLQCIWSVYGTSSRSLPLHPTRKLGCRGWLRNR